MSLPTLPAELIASITDHLPNKDIKRLRLTCRALLLRAILRISRVFLSPNRTNIDVFLAIAQHEHYRERVKEVIWDDAQLFNYIDPQYYDLEFQLDHSGSADPRQAMLPEYAARRKELWGEGVTSSTPDSAFRFYRNTLLRQQDAILAADEDVVALRAGLRAFTNLERATVTADAWGPRWLFPRLETPFFRQLPAGFWMPLPTAWHGDVVARIRRNGARPRDPNHDWERHLARPWDEERACHRGYRALTAELLALRREHPAARPPVRELVVDANRGLNGLPHALLRPSRDHLATLALFSALPLTRLDLALNAYCPRALHGAAPSAWHCFGPGLRQALDRLGPCLTRFSLSSTFVAAADRDASHRTEERPAAVDAWIPADRWPRLRRLGLARLVVDADALLRLLRALPPAAIESVELDSLSVSSSMRDALLRVRRELVLADGGRWTRGRPHVVTMEELPPPSSPPSTLWTKPVRRRTVVDEEVDDFLYRVPGPVDGQGGWEMEDDGFCPYGERGLHDNVGYDVDDYDPEYYVSNRTDSKDSLSGDLRVV